MTIDFGLILLEGVTLAVVVFGAVVVFMVRRWVSPASDAAPARLWLRFTVLLFVFSLVALIEGVLLRPYNLFWLALVVALTLFVVAKIAPKLLGWK
jgi:hypothetical protein